MINLKQSLSTGITILFLSLLAVSCAQEADDEARLNPEETFTQVDTPLSYTVAALNVTGPWGYQKSANKERLYPLLVSGCRGEGESNYQEIEQRYPAFVIDYQKNGVSDGEKLADWIDLAIAEGYRIDPNRIYLTGFSMGGSGSFPLARGMHNKGKFFAAIIRVAGQSESDLGEEIAKETAVWYHIGLTDTEKRVQVARQALETFRVYACNKKAKETTETDDITGHERSTITLTRSGTPYFKYSEYTDMGHTPSPCYKDKELFPWMFSMSLDN